MAEPGFSELNSSLNTLKPAIDGIMIILMALQLVFAAVSLGLWFFIRKKENLSILYPIAAIFAAFMCGGVFGLIGAGIISIAYLAITKKPIDVTNFTRCFALCGGIIGLFMAMINLAFFFMAPR